MAETAMIDAINNFQLLRPYWLLLLPISLLLTLLLWRYSSNSGQWQRLIRPELLQHLLEGQTGVHKRWPLLMLLLAWLIAIVAMSGPTWQKLPQPVYSSQDAVVLILDLSPSMMAQDLTPNRLTHARHRLIDLINSRQSGLTGLVVYAGDAHLLAPLSDDRQTLLSLVPSLSPEIMPLRGSQSEDAVKLALTMLQDAGQQRGKLVLITDGITAAAGDTIGRLLRDSHYTLSIIGVGTVQGAPIPLSDGSFVRNSAGELQLARLQPQPLQRLATASGGIYRTLSADDSDSAAVIEQLQPSVSELDLNNFKALQQRFDLWQEFGPWLVLLLLPLAAVSHRRGWLYCLLLLPPLYSEPALAWQWGDLWQTDNQQAQQQLQQGDYQQAAEQFTDSQWRAASLYRDEQYDQAAEQLKSQNDGRSAYNRGNALAQTGELEQAIESYQQALKIDPTLDDARFNQQLVERLLAQQNKQDNNDKQSGDGADSDQQAGSESGESSENNPDQQNDPQEGQEQNSNQPSDQGSDSDSSNSNPSDPAASNDAEEQSQAQADKTAQQNENEQQSTEPSDAAAQASATDPEKDAELERWLRQLPDDPGGLLRRKFQYQYQQKLEAYRQGRWQPPEETRW
ncbi:MAG: VWA domain-containing protein [Motiliproteus sp.]